LPPTTAATLLCAVSAEGAATAVVAAVAFLSSTGTSLNLTPDEQAAKLAANAKIQRLRLIMKNSNF
jgi:acetylglutamate kinase